MLLLLILAERLRLELRNRITTIDGLAIRSNTIMGPFQFLVRLVRLELTRLTTRASKTRMATNYITTAYFLRHFEAGDGFEPPTSSL